VGDNVILRGTERAAGIHSGDLGTVRAVDEHGKLTLESKSGRTKVVDSGSYKTFDYAYATTGHSAQSRTVDNVILLQTSSHRESVVNRASAYVGTSRTRRELFLVVDDFERAVLSMEREHEKAAALDLVPLQKNEAKVLLSRPIELRHSPDHGLELAPHRNESHEFLDGSVASS
jgi:ATP-dependent exoDNAse (exonuclease V) alpha subunit